MRKIFVDTFLKARAAGMTLNFCINMRLLQTRSYYKGYGSGDYCDDCDS